MSGVTPEGWPYITPDDHPLEYPAFSQQLATKVGVELSKGTGWRNISSLLINSFGGEAFLMRAGAMVTVALYNVSRSTAVTTPLAALADAPAGFKMPIYLNFGLSKTDLFDPNSSTIRAGSLVALSNSAGSWVLVGTWPVGAKLYAAFSYPTADPWPTTLPGVPA